MESNLRNLMASVISWILGFVIWFFGVIIFGIVTYLITSSGKNLKGKLPDFVFDYSYRSDILPENGYFLDTHGHTLASDGVMTAEQFVKWHIANGFNACVLTDHNTARLNAEFVALQEKYPEILLIPGFEWTTPRIHLNFLGIMDYPYPVPKNPTDEDIKEAIRKAKELGAVVQVDHITWTQWQPRLASGELVHPSREELLEWGVDGFEINNEMRWYDPKSVHFIEKLKSENRLKRPVYLCTGTDIHNPLREWATGWTEVLLTEEEKKAPDWDTVKKALLEGRTRIWVDHDYKVPEEKRILAEKGMLPHEKKGLFYNIFLPLHVLVNGLDATRPTTKSVILTVLWLWLAYFPLRFFFEFLTTLIP